MQATLSHQYRRGTLKIYMPFRAQFKGPDAGEERHQLDVLVYNVWLRPGYFLDGQAPRVSWLSRLLGGHDALILCETFHRRLGRRLASALAGEYPHRTRPLGGVSAPRPLGPGFKLANSGVMILSRWPIEAQGARSFDGQLAGSDAYSCKGVHHARINKRGQPYHLFGTHCQADPEPLLQRAYQALGRDAAASFLRLRMENFSRIRAFVDELSIPPHEPVLIAGDLNTDRLGQPGQFDAMLERLGASCPDDLRGHDSTFDPRQNTLVQEPHPMWLDYVLWSRSHLQPGASALEVHRMRASEPWRRLPVIGRRHRDLSDHYAVSGRFTFPG